MKKNRITQALGCTLIGYSSALFAQTAGADLQGGNKPMPDPKTSTMILNRVDQIPQGQAVQSGGPQVQLSAVSFSGNKQFTNEQLESVLGDFKSQPLDMAGLNNLVQRIRLHYKQNGFIFAQAFLPPQSVSSGQLTIQIIEGVYGTIKALGEDDLGTHGQPYLDENLHTADPIKNNKLERTLLIIDDLPGIKAQPILRPGNLFGSSDLLVNVNKDDKEESGYVGFDNTGPRSTGENRLKAGAYVNNKLQFGDKISINGLVTNRNMWFGSVEYDAPWGYNGTRASIGYTHSSYALGGDFASLGAHGVSDILLGQLYHPIIRSQATNVYGTLGLQHKSLEDVYDSVNANRRKQSNALLLGLRFDRRDAFAGGGVTYGSVTMTQGWLGLDGVSQATDSASAKTSGFFGKINLDLARIQSLTQDLNLYGRLSAQWANKNLDPSEKFNLGGFYGVRSHPLGEGTGDQGYLTQIELRYSISPTIHPFVFHDAGQSKSSTNPWDSNSGAHRTISARGMGVRTNLEGWSVDMTLAQQGAGGVSLSDTLNRNPRFFLSATKPF